jgi:hypothetical protein
VTREAMIKALQADIETWSFDQLQAFMTFLEKTQSQAALQRSKRT